MLTPAFELSQDDSSVTIVIKAPYAEITENDIYFEDYTFTFYCKPYYLRINLPGKVAPCLAPPVSYDFDKGIFTIQMEKAVAGEYFDGLDLLTKLLAPRKKPLTTTPLIEIIGNSSHDDDDDDDIETCDDWEIEQIPVSFDDETLLSDKAKCGFANLYSCSVFKLEEEVRVIFDITDLSTKLPQERLQERLAMENDKFNDDHYLADLYEDDDIKLVFDFCPKWEELYEQMKSEKKENFDDSIKFSSEEKRQMVGLPNKEYLLTKPEKRALLLGIVDILFGYAYNKRTTFGENTCESGWTINKLSSTLSWLETFTSIHSVAQSCVRRSLCYPLYRHWVLTMKVLEDVSKILSLGRKYVLKCFLEIHEIFCNSSPRYILNDLYITDYCIWIQSRSCKSRALLSLAESLKKVQISKADMNLEIVELERAAKLHILSLIEASNGTSTEAVVSVDNSSLPNSDEFCTETDEDSETLCLKLKDLKVDSKICESNAELSECENVDSLRNLAVQILNEDGNSGACCPHVSSHEVLPMVADSLQNDLDNNSETESSSDSCCSSTSCELDSDDCSSSTETDSDLESTCSDTSDEHCKLLKKDQSYERRR